MRAQRLPPWRLGVRPWLVRLRFRRWRRLVLLLGERLGFAPGLGRVGRLVIRGAGRLGDVAHYLPRFLVGDGNETVVAVEFLAHGRRKIEGEEAGFHLIGE